MSERYFDGVQLRDSVYAGVQGMVVDYIRPDGGFSVKAPDGTCYVVDSDGKLINFEELGQMFFWQPVHIKPPPRPKRVVTKVVEGWVTLYPNNRMGALYPTKEEAIEERRLDHLGDPIYIKHEYEVEE